MSFDWIDYSKKENEKVMYSSFAEFYRDYYCEKIYITDCNENSSSCYHKNRETIMNDSETEHQLMLKISQLRDRIYGFPRYESNSSPAGIRIFTIGENSTPKPSPSPEELDNLSKSEHDLDMLKEKQKTYKEEFNKIDKDARKIAQNTYDDKDSWNSSISSLVNSANAKIKGFFSSLGVDHAIFQKNHHYVLTQSLCILFREILNMDKSIIKNIRKHDFKHVSFENAHGLYQHIIEAIEYSPATDEDKKSQIEQLTTFFSQKYDFDIRSFYGQNDVVNAILHSVWYAAMDHDWAKNCTSRDEYFDHEWNCIIDQVYRDLYNKKIIIPEKDNLGKEHMVLINKIPNPYTIPKEERKFWQTKMNPNPKAVIDPIVMHQVPNFKKGVSQ